MSMGLRVATRAVAVLCFVLLAAKPAFGVAKTWTNGANNNDWNNLFNWQPWGVPSAVDTVTIGIGAECRINAGNAFSVGSITVNSGATLKIADGVTSGAAPTAKLTINSDSVVNGTLRFHNGQISGPGKLTVNGHLEFSGGKFDGTGARELKGTSTWYALYNWCELNATSLTNSGTMTFVAPSGSFSYRFPASGSLKNTGNIVISADAQLQFIPGTTFVLHNESGGKISKTGGSGTSSVQIEINNQSGGTLEVTSGTMALADGGTFSGACSISSGKTLSLTSGIFTVTGTASVSGAGTLSIAGGTLALKSGVDITVPNLSMNATMSKVDGLGLLRVSGTFGWSGGTMTGGGTTELKDTSTPTISCSLGDCMLNNRVLTLRSSTSYTASANAITLSNSSDLNIANTATLVIAGDGDIDAGSITDDFITNNGKIWKKTGSGISNIAVPIKEMVKGTIDVDTGTLQLGAGLSFTSGTIDIASGATLALTGGTTQLVGVATMPGTGAFLVKGGTLRIPSSVTQTVANLTLQSGVIDGAGTLVLDGIATWSGGTMGSTSAPGGTTRIDNGDTLNLSPANGTTILTNSRQLLNQGTINVTKGTLQLSGGGNHSGTFIANALGSVVFSGGTHTLTGSINGPGTVMVTGGTLSVNTSLSLAALSLAGGTLGGTGDVSLTGNATWTGGAMTGSGKTTVGSTVTFGINGGATLARAFVNNGTLNYSPSTVSLLLDGITLTNNGIFNIASDVSLSAANAAAFTNNGTLQKTAGAGGMQFAAPVTNKGSVELTAGTLHCSGGYVQTAGTTNVGTGATLRTATLDLDGGTLTGRGTVMGNVTNDAAVSPGASPGTLTIDGDYVQSAGGALNVELGGTTAGTQFDQLNVTGSVTLAGALNVYSSNGFAPSGGNTFKILTYGSRPGSTQFDTITGVSFGSALFLTPGWNTSDLTLVANVIQSDLSASAEASSSFVPDGNAFTYTITVANYGGSNATNVSFSAALPPNVIFDSAFPPICTGAPNLVCTIGALANQETSVVTLNVIANGAGSAPLSVSVSGSEFDPNHGNNNASTATTITLADLAVSVNGPASALAGTTATYTIVVTNHGPDPATGTSVSFAPHSALSFVSSSGACAALPCSLGTLAAGQVATIDTTWSIGPGATGSTYLTASVLSSSPPDPTSGNNSDTATTSITREADVQVTKSGPASVPPEATAPITYDLVVTNNGPSTATNVQLSDPTPAGLSFVSASGACSAFPCVFDTLAPGQTKNVQASFNVNGAGTTVTNTATVTSGSDTNSENDSASATTAIGSCPVVAIAHPATVDGSSTGNTASVPLFTGAAYAWTITNGTITAGANTNTATFTAGATGMVELSVTVTAGACTSKPSASISVVDADLSVTKSGPSSVSTETTTSITYTINVTNNGPSIATSVVLDDPLPAGLTFVSATGACTAFPCALGSLASGQAAPVQATYSFTSNTPPSVTNTASVSSATSDRNAANNTASVMTAIDGCPIVTITHPATVDGSSTGNTASVPLFTGATYAWTITDGVITAGASTNTVTFTASATGTVGLNVTVSAGGCTSSPSASIPIVDADLAVTKSGPSSVSTESATSITYTINVTNNGPSTATNVVLDDPAPAGLTFVSATGACTAFPCALGSLASGQAAPVQATYSFTLNAPPSVTNTASVSSATSDRNAANNTASATTAIGACTPVVIAAPSELFAGASAQATAAQIAGATYTWSITNGAITSDESTNSIVFTAGDAGTTTLTVTVTAGACTATASAQITVSTQSDVEISATALAAVESGAAFNYTLTVRNHGPSEATSAVVTDTLPAGAAFVSVDPATCTGNSTITCNLGAITKGSTRTVIIRVNAPQGPATLTNTASVTASDDPFAANNFSTVTTGVIGSACPTTSPQLIAPTANDAVISPVTFVWNAVPGATGYALFAGENGAALKPFGTTSSTSLRVALAPGTLSWRVDALFPGDCPAVSSAVSTFTVQSPCDGQATPLSPADLTTTSDPKITFEWTAVDGSAGYRVWLQSGTAAAHVLATTLGTSHTEVIGAGTYGWWIETLFAGCASRDSLHRTLTVTPSQTCSDKTPVLVSPAAETITTTASVGFIWNAVAGALEYELWLAPAGGVPTLLHTTEQTSHTIALAPGRYEWFVRAVFAGCPATQSAARVITYAPPASCVEVARPVLTAPFEGERLESPVSFAWRDVTGAVEYDLFIDGALETTTAASQTSIEVPAGKRSWFVRARFSACAPLDSSESRFVVIEPPPPCAPLDAPSIAAPGQISANIPALIQWTAVPGATEYVFEHSATPSFDAVSTVTQLLANRQFPLALANDTSAPVARYLRVHAADSGCIPPLIGPLSRIAVIYVLPKHSAAGSIQIDAPVTLDYELQLPPEFAGLAFAATPTVPWIRVTPASGIVPAGGGTIVATVHSADLPPGTSIGGVQINTASLLLYGAQPVSFPISVNLVSPVTPTPPSTPPPDALIIPAVASARGINAEFQSDVRVSNTSAQVMKYLLTFIPSGDAGITAGRQTTFSVEPGQTIALDSILQTWFGTGGENASGMLEIRPLTEVAKSISSAAVGALANLVTFASSRTFNVTPNGTYGQFIPAIPFANFIARGERLSLQQIAQSARFRTNVGFVEGSGNPVSLLVRVFGPSGQPMQQVPLTLNGGQHTQVNAFLAQHGISSLVDGRLEVEVSGGDGKVTAYASVLDNETGDPLFVSPVALDGKDNTKWVIPGVAQLATGNANWQSDVRLFNAGAAPVELTLAFHSMNGGAPKTAPLTLAAGEVRALDGVLSLFGAAQDGGALHITSAAAAQLIATARTYNATTHGDYGQFISAITPEEAVGMGARPLQLLQVEQSERYRSNIGFFEVTGKPVTLEVSVIVPNSKATAVTQIRLAGNEFRQLTSMLAAIVPGNVYNARIAVRAIAGEGRAAAYASVIDLKTNDPTYVPAQ